MIIEEIENFLNFIINLNNTYDMACEKVSNCDKVTSDYLSLLEIKNLCDADRLTLCEKLRLCRIEYRKYKYIMDTLPTLITWLNRSPTYTAISELEKILDDIKKIKNDKKGEISE